MQTFCQLYNSRRMTQELIDDLVDYLKSLVDNPTGIWQDFNPIYAAVLELHKAADQEYELLCDADLPDFPNPDDYPDLTSEKTVPFSIPVDMPTSLDFPQNF